MEQEQRLWELFSRELSGRLSDQERVELDLLKARFPEAAKRLEMLNTLSFRSKDSQSDERKEELLGRIFSAVENDRSGGEAVTAPERKRGWLVAVPLVAALAAGAWYWAASGPDKAPREWSTVQTRKGAKSKLTLPDGTVVTLNAGSTLSYADDFKNGAREVRLNGEGYFNVAPMAGHPFIVYTRALEVKVLGTAFNIQAYEEEGKTETTLFSGKVEVLLKNEGKRYMLKPRQKLEVLHTLPPRDTIARTQPEKVTAPALQVQLKAAETEGQDSALIAAAWVENKFVFRDEPLNVLARRLERWYNVEVEIRGEELAQARFTGSVENEPLPQILEILAALKPIHYKITANKVTIY
ncbi:hypothetical protein DLD77_01335 [Chitinophaga alhagiae]|uniref:FecR family protein n=1 Tax=Chitinophaga alhagiae TaxID=2203219 RepID=A0ABM6W953_9BACT|nr:FecR family protein [Chitinophaga alhagiae]AWO00443.1 hypothetical protein DLD77_01335 [Chitinophaga alhagiae]